MQTVKVKPLVRAEDCRYKYAITRVINPAGERYMLTMKSLDDKLKLCGAFITEQSARSFVRKAQKLFK